MKELIIIIVLLIANLSFGNTFAATYISLNDHRTNDYLEYLNTSGSIDIDFIGIKPYRTDIIYKLLVAAENKNATFLEFIKEFEKKYLHKEEKFGTTRSKYVNTWFDPYMKQSYTSQNAIVKPILNVDDFGDVSQHITDGGLNVFLSYKDFLSLYSDTGVKIKHNINTPLRDEFQNEVLSVSTEEGFKSEDHTETILLLYGEDINLSLGKYPISMGSSMLNSLTLSKQNAYYENMLFSIQSSNIKFSTITGFLHPDSETRDEIISGEYAITNQDSIRLSRSSKREKYFSGHRLEWRPIDNLHLGLNEMVVSGDRTIELGYLFPILPLRWMEHYYGDHDNALISMDIRYRPINNLSLYSEFLIDDETFSVSWTKSYANKWGFLFGLHNTNFLTISDLAFNFEYSRIEPYVYTHRFHINRYMNLDSYLGNPYGPDSETIDLKLKYFYDFNTNITLGYTRANIGEPLWGLPDEPDDYDIENKVFLRGTVEKTNYYYAEVSYFYNKYIGVDLFYSHTDVINYNHNLPVYDDNWYGDYVDGTYTDYDDYYDQEISPNKQYQVYSNNTFRITLNLMFKNYLLK